MFSKYTQCTSLPSIYLTEDAPKCYRCGGVGHFARFCPTSGNINTHKHIRLSIFVEKQFRHRERRASLPVAMAFPPADWSSFYFNDLLIPQMTAPDQIFLVRPEYVSSCSLASSVENIEEDELMSDCSSVDYIVEPAGEENMVEISVQTDK